LVSFKNTIIIFTSNVGVSDLPKKRAGFGFGIEEMNNNDDYEIIKETLIGAFKKRFKPEFVNRIDVTTVFHPLEYEQLAQIAKLFICNLNKRLQSQQSTSLKMTESALRYLIEKGYDREYGARPLRRLIEQEIEDRLAEMDASIVPLATRIRGAFPSKVFDILPLLLTDSTIPFMAICADFGCNDISSVCVCE
jgi:ATP-dependent Clp protease ATP-binding subunit ClpC